MSKLRSACALAVFVLAACGGDPPSDTDAGGSLDAARACGAGEESCAGACVDVISDRGNCGACGNACGTGEVCGDGACGVACPDGQTDCDGGCYDTDSARAHCGACGVACDDGEVCSESACAVSCGGGLSECDGVCRDLQTDRAHCGTCGSTCDAGEVCAAGVCEISCGGGVIECDGACVDPSSDRAHCSGCGVACSDGQACVDGACAVICPPGQAQCDGVCVDSTRDRAHCGGCGVACDAGEVCTTGACVLSCGGATPTQCGTSCVDTTRNPAHCGACDDACPAGAVCTAGVCQATCPTGTTDCGGACVSTSFDPANCGACGTTCSTAANAVPVCAASACSGVCAVGYGDCDGDLGATGGDGCETNLATSRTDCGACGNECVASNATTGCAASTCVISACSAGFANCDASYANGCEADTRTNSAHCGGCGIACGAGQSCTSGVCLGSGTATGESCASPYPIVDGPNSIAWVATTADYLTTTPSCVAVGTLEGPDVVLQYTATATGHARFTMHKPLDNRYVIIPSAQPCGTIAPQLACISDWAPATMSGEIPVTAGSTYYLYVRDGSSGSLPLPFPMRIDVGVISCSSVAPDPSVAPANGTTTTTRSPSFVATFGHAVSRTMGIVTITGNMGTSRSYDLSMAPSQVTFSASDTVMTINPGMAFPPGEVLTVSLTGMFDARCARPQPAMTWSVTIASPSCAPGAGGLVGTSVTTVPTGLASVFEYYVAADQSPTGYVYVGETLALFRVPKAGGAAQDVEALAGLTTSHLGYAMLIDGNDIYTFDSKTTGTTGHVWRISRDGGATWVLEDYATFPTVPLDDIHGAVLYDGEIYMITHELTTGTATQIWSVPAGSAAPVTATLRASLVGPRDCTSIAVDGGSYYLACAVGGELLRVNRTTNAVTTITTSIDLSSTNNEVHGRDVDGDGTVDVLYVHRGAEQVHYVCGPATASPYVDVLTTWGPGTGNQGLSFDPVANVLWSFDDDTVEFVRIQ